MGCLLKINTYKMNILKISIFVLVNIFIISIVNGEVYFKNTQSSQKKIIINNPSIPKYKGEIFEKELEFKINPEEMGKYYLNRPSQIVLDNKCNIYVLDNKELRIIKFDPQGQFLKIIGKPGAGPGELNGLTSIFITNNKLGAWCAQNNHLNYFDLNGEFLGSSISTVGISQLNCDSYGNLFGVISSPIKEEKLVLLEDDLSIKRIIDKRAFEQPKFYGVGLLYSLTKSKNIIVGNMSGIKDYKIKVFNYDGELIREIRKDHQPLRIPSEDIEIVRKNNIMNWEIPEYFMPFSRIYNNEKGMILVTAYTRRGKKNETGFNIFDKEGKYLADIIFKSYLYYCLWENGRLYTIEENEEGSLMVKVFKLKWKD